MFRGHYTLRKVQRLRQNGEGDAVESFGGGKSDW